jgi:hypothetical protein
MAQASAVKAAPLASFLIDVIYFSPSPPTGRAFAARQQACLDIQ